MKENKLVLKWDIYTKTNLLRWEYCDYILI